MKLLVLGIGNVIMNDDAAGALVVRELEEKYGSASSELRIVEGGTLGLDLLPMLEWSDKMILLDAVDLGLPAGTVVKIEGKDIDDVIENKLSPHQMGMKDLLITAAFAGCCPAEIVFYGIQIKSIEMEIKLSPEVEQGCVKLKKHVEEEITNFLSKCNLID